MNTAVRATATAIYGLAAVGLLLFLPAGTFNYWQAWVFIATSTVSTTVPSVYLARTNPAALRRRMQGGPQGETRTLQKIAITGAIVAFVGMLMFSAYDHRMGWSQLPAWLCLVGDALVALGLCIAMLVVIQNGYAAANITVETGQTVVSTGLYRLVRHPMYAGNAIMMVGIPLALDSYWGLLFAIPGVAVLVVRILDEEKMLAQELAGYREYTQRVRFRLLPNVW
ncbi:isoprenylcysteine carboxylmethyltransferase family protein [Mycobacterium sp. 050272]|uniref:methyltransferase family protein n=1 Tax=Mycobacterium sp. 050272 TaxID=3142488 RepID=UPI0031896633